MDCLIDGVRCGMTVDFGSKYNIISENDWKELKEKKCLVRESKIGSSKNFKVYGEEKSLTVLGTFKAVIQINNKRTVMLTRRDDQRSYARSKKLKKNHTLPYIILIEIIFDE